MIYRSNISFNLARDALFFEALDIFSGAVLGGAEGFFGSFEPDSEIRDSVVKTCEWNRLSWLYPV